MKHTVRDVVLLGAAMSAFMLLVVLSPVGAEEVPPPASEVRLVANTTASSPLRTAPVEASDVAPASTTTAEGDTAAAPREGPCDQVRRIGKFTVTRCD